MINCNVNSSVITILYNCAVCSMHWTAHTDELRKKEEKFAVFRWVVECIVWSIVPVNQFRWFSFSWKVCRHHITRSNHSYVCDKQKYRFSKEKFWCFFSHSYQSHVSYSIWHREPSKLFGAMGHVKVTFCLPNLENPSVFFYLDFILRWKHCARNSITNTLLK